MKRSYLVVGGGLIGTSIAIALVAGGHTVFVCDTDAQAQAAAQAKSGARAWDGTEVDTVVVATPPGAAAAVMRQMAEQMPRACVTDTASVKAAVFAALADSPVADQARMVGGHPMAGREVSGAKAAVSNLFVDRPWVLTRGPHTSDAALAAVRDMVLELGAVPIERSPSEHDQAVALVSHAPQVVASVMAAQLSSADSDVELAGQGLRDTVRIAGSDPALWVQILAANGHHVADRIDQVAAQLQDAASAIRSGDQNAIETMLSRGKEGHARLPGKHGSPQSAIATLVVRVEDRPGELARLFAVAAASEVNLEDVRIDHSLGRMTGLVELAVSPQAAATLTAALAAAEFRVVG